MFFCLIFLNGGLILIALNIAVFIPFIAAIFIPLLYRKGSRIHIGVLPLLISAVLFAFFLSYIPSIANGETFLHTMSWIPTYDINFIVYLDGLSLIFALLITGIGSLVILYSIYYLSDHEELGN